MPKTNIDSDVQHVFPHRVQLTSRSIRFCNHTVRIWYGIVLVQIIDLMRCYFDILLLRFLWKCVRLRHFDHEHAVTVPFPDTTSYQPFPLSRIADLFILGGRVYFVNKTSPRQYVRLELHRFSVWRFLSRVYRGMFDLDDIHEWLKNIYSPSTPHDLNAFFQCSFNISPQKSEIHPNASMIFLL